MLSREEPGRPCQTQGHPWACTEDPFQPAGSRRRRAIKGAHLILSVKPQPRLPPTLRTDGDKAQGVRAAQRRLSALISAPRPRAGPRASP